MFFPLHLIAILIAFSNKICMARFLTLKNDGLRILTREKRSDFFNNNELHFVSSVDYDGEENEEQAEKKFLSKIYDDKRRQSKRSAFNERDALRNIQRELEGLNEPLRQQDKSDNNNIAKDNVIVENNSNGKRRWSITTMKRKNAPHFLHTPPPLMTADPRCNSESLQRIMIENMSDNVKGSKHAIIQAAEALIGGSFNVICAKTHFSYITSTRLFCLVVKRNAKCYAFLTDGMSSESSGSLNK